MAAALRSSILWLCAVLLMLGATARADTLADIEALHKQGQTEQALQQADAAIALQPRSAQIRFLKAVMLGDLGRDSEAIDSYVSLTQDFPELADPYNNLAVLYAASGRLDAALLALQQALRNDPGHRQARENLGDVYLALAVQAWQAAEVQSKGDDAKLLRKLQQAESIVPKSAQQGSSRHRR
jgi:tetratricopeptide (TPR) repeat protein